MEYFVTGATGFVGSHVVEKLVEQKDEVIALTRDRSNASHLPDEATIIEGDITEKESIRDGMTGVDGVFHIAGWYRIGPGPRRAGHAERINVDGTRTVLELVDELDIPKAVYTSTIAINSDTDGEVVDESYRYDGNHISVYDRTKWQAHYEVAKPMADEGVPVVIIQPGIVYGPGDTSDLRPMWRDYLQEDLPVIPRDVDACWDHVEDTAQAHLLAMEHGKEGEEYIVCGEQRTFVEMFELAEAITGVPAPRSVSPLLFRALAPAMKVAERFVRPPEGFESEFLYRMGGTTWLGDNTKAKRELGLEHRPIEEGLREYLEWELDQLEAEGETSKEPTQEATPDKAV
jgi:dihydroflavonol-4-reductase